MRNTNFHPSDQDLLLFSDGELPGRQAARIRRHLRTCWSCRAQAAKIEATIGEFMDIHRQNSEQQLPPIAGPRALLKARLAQSALAGGRNGRERWFLAVYGRGLAYVCALALMVAVGASILFRLAKEQESDSREYATLLPNPSLTPGATRPIAVDDICAMDHDEVVLPISATLRQRVFEEYGMRNMPFENYEVDYLITPGLGGSDDIRNLWPQPRYHATWNSFVKDRLEDYLHQMVCRRELNLATAQKDVAKDWISAYKKYFHTNVPLALNASSRWVAGDADGFDSTPVAVVEDSRQRFLFTGDQIRAVPLTGIDLKKAARST
jgi:hypothetical protein